MKPEKEDRKSEQRPSKQSGKGAQTQSELKGNATVAETPGSNKSERTGKARRLPNE